MFGQNIITKPIKRYSGQFWVNSIFYTLQGEGIFSGQPAVFIRLRGCNLQCPFCDTQFDDGDQIKTEDIINRVKELSQQRAKLVVITGGEPFLQPIEHLCKYLLKAGFAVQIETNGTLWRPTPKRVYIVCSPKFDNKGEMFIHQQILRRASCLKFLISKNNAPFNSVPEAIEARARKMGLPIYVQPMDERNEISNKENLRWSTKLALEKGYNMSIQLHKLLEIE